MRTRICTDKPETIVFRLTIEATAREFEQLRDQLENQTAHPASEFKHALNDVLAQARKIFWAKEAE